MSEREQIFARIREALQRPAAKPGHRTGPADQAPPPDYQQWLPAVGPELQDHVEAFRRASEELKTDFRWLERENSAAQTVQEIGRGEGWQRVATHQHALTDAVCAELEVEVLRTDGGYDTDAMAACDAGISACDFLVAQTGTVVVTSRSAGGRALSVLPPHHVVLARHHQLVPDLPTALRRIRENYGSDYPSFIGLITGPSRTGDIERILVLGAHGPKKLTVICC